MSVFAGWNRSNTVYRCCPASLGAYSMLPLDFKSAESAARLLVQHLRDLEAEAEAKGGVQQVLADHFAKVNPDLAA
jgi:hypothetical protein